MFEDIRFLLKTATACFFFAGVAAWFLPKMLVEHEELVIQSLSVEELVSRILAKENILLLDVRNALLYDISHIPGAVNFPESDWVSKRAIELTRDRYELVVVYCSSSVCGDSKQVAHLLLQHGVTRVSVLTEGWAGWEAHMQEPSGGDGR